MLEEGGFVGHDGVPWGNMNAPRMMRRCCEVVVKMRRKVVVDINFVVN
jgi:hypothetical protein